MAFDLNSLGITRGSEIQGPTYLRFLVYAPPKSGKTTFALTFPDPLDLDLEKSGLIYAKDPAFSQMIPDMMTPDRILYKPTDAVDLLNIMRKMDHEGILNNPQKIGIGTIIVDPITIFSRDFRNLYLERKIQNIAAKQRKSADDVRSSVFMEMNDWPKAKLPENELATLLRKANCHKVLTAHSGAVMEEVEQASGRIKMEKVDEEAQGAKQELYDADVILEFLSIDDPDNQWHEYRVCRVRHDRTKVFKEKAIIRGVSYKMWHSYVMSGARPTGAPASTQLPARPNDSLNRAVEMVMSNPRVKALAERLGYTSAQLEAGAEKYQGNLDEVLQLLEEKVKALPPAEPAPLPPEPTNNDDF